MIVCVSEELLYIRKELEKRGYKVITSLKDEICDAIICNLKDGGLKDLTFQNTLNRDGTLIVDSGSRSIDEIEYILNNRTYSSIF
ncbi:YkuS family protein [Clostridium sp. MSJ-11]|uniref:YkuS family protein n=1 Tax=Clostridium mobile TaxID=2841512 RepID=A0ABS6EMD1_9CLOT|nr:YkuS family protein [Clostridium mobile]MBU5486391.1 YkuS family protein [Clostridium mobile]